MKKYKKDYDFTGLACEITGDALYLINGGKEIENSIKAQSEAHEGDVVTNSKGETRELTQSEIDWAKAEMARREQTSASQPAVNAETANNSDGNHNSENQNQDRDLRVTPANYQDPVTDARGYYSTGANYQTADVNENNSMKGNAFVVHKEVSSSCESKKNIHGQVTIGFNLNAVAMIGFDASIGLQFNLDDPAKSGMLLSGGFASGTSLGASVFAGYNSGKADAENIGTFSVGYGSWGGNVGIDTDGKLSLGFSYAIPGIGIDGGMNFSKQHMIVLPRATEEEKSRLLDMYHEHH